MVQKALVINGQIRNRGTGPIYRPEVVPTTSKQLNTASLWKEVVDVGRRAYNPVIEHQVRTSEYDSKTNTVVDTYVYNPVPNLTQIVIVKMFLEDRLNVEIAALVDKYPRVEQETFAEQLIEAKGWNADKTYATPLLDGIVSTSHLTKADLVTKLLQKKAELAVAKGPLIGTYQALIKRLEDGEDPVTVVWPE